MELGRLLRCALTLISGSASVLCLRCSMCTVRDGIDQAVTTDNLRIITDVRKPYCTSGHEEVECSSGQDTCMTIVVHMPDNGKYWLAKGCTVRMPFSPLGCHHVQTETQEMGLDEAQSHLNYLHAFSGAALQEVCLCDTDHCNASTTNALNCPLLFVLICLSNLFTLSWST
ncbi:hypothetical protein T10_12647 [Trichinella papuae]|uniref:Protein quiver n=1 Tax=Trichinella papuae TaxID=268474 RepID=A0A0V1MHT0_9BILA|nr:hypothetical protein T10_3764 [Trichinella papuae]KRZ71161.1 hypothetical protein T10_12647 [Trichinella papuae]